MTLDVDFQNSPLRTRSFSKVEYLLHAQLKPSEGGYISIVKKSL